MSTTASGKVAPGGSGEGRWWGTGCNGYIELYDLAVGDTFVMWGVFGYIDDAVWGPSGPRAEATVISGGTDLYYMRVTVPGQLAVWPETCYWGGLLMHEVLAEMDDPETGCA
ncbi:MAG: hypothetical protein ACOYB2_10640 [Limnohabitans sp.]